MAISSSANIPYGQPFNTGTGVAISVGDILDQIKELTGCQKPVVTEEERIRPEKSEVGLLLADNTQLRARTSWHPEFDLAAGLDETINWWRRQIQAGLVRNGSGYVT